jgi:hypothetical protein
MLTYADVCSRMLMYAHVCSHMLTYAHVCSRTLRRLSQHGSDQGRRSVRLGQRLLGCKTNLFDFERRLSIEKFVNQIPHLTPDSQKLVAKCLIDTDVDLETLSTLRHEWGGDDTLKELE